MKKLGVVNSATGVASTNGDSPNQDFFEEVMDFIENDDAGEEFADAEDEDDHTHGATDRVGTRATKPTRTNYKTHLKNQRST